MAEKSTSTITLMAGGDVGPNYEPVERFPQHILPILKQADIRFAQCERVYSNRGTLPLEEGGRLPPSMASIWDTAGIDLISMAGNHGMDNGSEAMLDTMELLRGMGKHIAGAGKNKEEAHSPAIVERNGVKVALLAYCSVITEGHEAGDDKPGMAPMRAYTFYQRGKDQTEEFHPGTPPVILTLPDENDLSRLQDDVRKAKEIADVVIVSLHWGIHMIPKAIATYQPKIAHAAIDAGADLILGHHAHCLKAIEVYKGRVCFYSLGNYMMSSRANVNTNPQDWSKWNLYYYRVDPEYLRPDSIFRYPYHSCYSMIVKAKLSKRGVEKISFIPTLINRFGQPVVTPPTDAKFQEILEYVKWSSDEFPTTFRVEGGEVVVAGS